MSSTQIGSAQASDGPAILEIILPAIREAATYALEGDPLADLTATGRIKLRVKRGLILDLSQ